MLKDIVILPILFNTQLYNTSALDCPFSNKHKLSEASMLNASDAENPPISFKLQQLLVTKN
jgi:hypothetical protein